MSASQHIVSRANALRCGERNGCIEGMSQNHVKAAVRTTDNSHDGQMICTPRAPPMNIGEKTPQTMLRGKCLRKGYLRFRKMRQRGLAPAGITDAGQITRYPDCALFFWRVFSPWLLSCCQWIWQHWILRFSSLLLWPAPYRQFLQLRTLSPFRHLHWLMCF